MRTKLFLLLFTLIATSLSLCAQDQGYLDGKVFLDSKDKPAYTSSIRIFQGERLVQGTTADIDGFFRIKPLNPGKYSVVISYMGYHNDTIINVPISSGTGTDLGTNILIPTTTMLTQAIINGVRIYEEPLIDKSGGMNHSLSSKQLGALPNPTSIIDNLQYISSEFQVTPGTKEIHFRGSRDGQTAFYVDGVRVDSPEGIPKFAIAGMKVYAGGVPARYGDFTGGVVVIETKSFFDWEQEQRALIMALEVSKAPKREAAKKSN